MKNSTIINMTNNAPATENKRSVKLHLIIRTQVFIKIYNKTTCYLLPRAGT